MNKIIISLALCLSLAACSGEPEPPKGASVQVDGEHAVLSEPDKADFLKLATVERAIWPATVGVA